LTSACPSSCIDGTVERGLGVGASEESEEAAVWGRDGKVRQVLASHPLDHVFQAGARADGARAGCHRLLGRDVLSVADRAAPDPAEHDAHLVEDEAGVAARLVEALARILQAIVGPAARDVAADMGADARLASLRACEGVPKLPQSALPAV
jgi:hypothetical protein